jgi:hypothetical protein
MKEKFDDGAAGDPPSSSGSVDAMTRLNNGSSDKAKKTE